MTDAEKAIPASKDDRSSLEKGSDVYLDTEKIEGSIPSENEIDPVIEKKLLWKMDLILMPMCTIICELPRQFCGY